MKQSYTVIDVKSTSIKQIIWDNVKGQLMIKFHDSPIYVYPDVSRDIFDAFVKAESKGKYFAVVIKKLYPRFLRLDN